MTATALLASGIAAAAGGPAVAGFPVVGDGIPVALGERPGDAARGRAIVASRQQGLCLLCHRAPIAEERQQGDIGTDLAGAGSRWSAAQLRLRIADPKRLDPTTPMPAYLKADDLDRVGSAWQGRSILTPQQVEDVVAWLVTLK